MGGFPDDDDDKWAPLLHLATVAIELEEKEKLEKERKLKKEKELVLENKNWIKKEWLEGPTWLQKRKCFNSDVYYQENLTVFPVQERMINQTKFDGSGERCRKWIEGFNSNEIISWNVSNNQVQEITSTKRKNYGSGEGCSKWPFEGFNSNEKNSCNVSSINQVKRKFCGSGEGCSYNDHNLSGQKTKRSSNVIEIPSPELPEAFKNAIRDKLNGGTEFTGEMMLVIEKNLSDTDTTRGHNRLSLPAKQIRQFLKPNEYNYLKEQKQNHKHNHIEVQIIEPSLEKCVVDLRFWESNSHYALTGTWYDLVTRNGLEEGDFVQLWAFRIAEELLCFALSTVPSRKIPKKVRRITKKNDRIYSVEL